MTQSKQSHKVSKFNNLPADERIVKMKNLYNYLLAKAPVTFPPPTTTVACGFNYNLLEDIVCGIQARMCLYLMTPDTGTTFLVTPS